MVRDDPSLIDGFTKKETAQAVKLLMEKRSVKMRGMRANNLAAATDVRRTLEHMLIEVCLAGHSPYRGPDSFFR